MVDTGLWDVLLSPGKTERMTLEQLDASFQTGTISAGTLIREPGSNDWRPLYEVAGLDPPSQVELAKPPPPSKPIAVASPVTTDPAASNPAAVSAPHNAETRSRPPALPARRSGPPSKRTGRGVPLPSAPPRDDGPNTLNPKPLTPPRTTSRRVSAPPSAPTSGSGSRTRRAPPSILSAPVKPGVEASPAAPNASHPAPKATPNTLPAGSPAAVRPVVNPTAVAANKASAPTTSARASAASTTKAAPSTPKVGGASANAIKPAPMPVVINTPIATPEPPSATTAPIVPLEEIVALPPAAPAPVISNGPGLSQPPAKPSVRDKAPPLPDNAFAHLNAPVVATPMVPVTGLHTSGLPSGAPAPNAPATYTPYPSQAPMAYSLSPITPFVPGDHLAVPPSGAMNVSPATHALGTAPFSAPGPVAPAYVSPAAPNPWAAPVPINPMASASPFIATDTTQGLVLEDRPAPAARLAKSEVALWALLVLLGATVICHRNGMLRQWFGASPQSSYAQFEAQMVGKPSLETVAGVRAFLSELGPEAPKSATPASSRKR